MHPILLHPTSLNIHYWAKDTDRPQHSGSGKCQYSSITNRYHPHTKKKINKETIELNDTIDLMDLTEVYRVFHPATPQYTFFSEANRKFSKKQVLTNMKKLK
jgi:exonuclease III